MAEWYKKARLVWHSLLSTQPRVDTHKFRWEAATGKIACPDMGASAISATLRAMARRLDDSILLMKKGVPAADSRIRTNSANNFKACEKKMLRSPDVNSVGLRSWCVLTDKALHADDLDKAAKLLSTLTKKALKLEEKQSKAVQCKWKQALTQSSGFKRKDSGHGGRLSRLAYRWVKGVAGWSRSTVGPAGDEAAIPSAEPGDHPNQIHVTNTSDSGSSGATILAPRSDQAEVDAIAKTWAKLWQTDKQYTLPDFSGADEEALEPLTVDDLLRAAATFPVTTGLGVDNFSPRAVLRLPRPLLQQLADLLNKGEQLGQWDEALELVIIVLLPKGDGSHRPIGLFPGIIRIWMRARSGKAREWETETAGPEYFGCKGRGAQRAAWMAAFEAELATARGLDHAASLIDLVKAFEMIPHCHLVQAARQHGFSLKVLRLSLAAYRITRVIGVDSVFSQPVQATRGITAGSGMATSELRLILTDMIYLLRTTFPVALKLYVDDLTITASGDGVDAARAVAEATDFAVANFKKLGLEVSAKKSVATASRPRVLSTIMALCKSGALTSVTQAKLLGSSFTAGGRRSVKVLQARIIHTKKAVHKIQQLGRLGLSAVEYVRGAAVPAMMYGCEITGMGDTMVAEATQVAAAALTPPTAGKNPTMVMHAAAVHSEAVNPNLAANVGPIKAWASASWEGWARVDQMTEVFKYNNSKLKEMQPNHWNGVRGPAAAVVATCIRLQWRSEDGIHFRDDVGMRLDITLDSPQVFANAAKRSVARLNIDAVLKHLPAAAPLKDDILKHSTFSVNNERDGGRRSVLVNLVPFLSPLYRGSKSVGRYLPQWTTKCKGYLNSAINGGQWTQTMKAKLPGFTGTSKCQLCHMHDGTLAHRHCCPVTVPTAGWTTFESHSQAFIQSISEDRAAALRTRATLTVSIPIAEPQIPTNGWCWLSDPPRQDLDNLTWVIDGSRRYASDWTLATTGCGVAVLDVDGKLIAYATATPPPWVKTAGAAEAWALLLTLRENPAPPVVLTDCMALLHAARAGPAFTARGKNSDARLWKEISESTGGCYRALLDRLVWMPSHTSNAAGNVRVKSNGRALTTAEWRANQLADTLAKRGALVSPLREEADAIIKTAGATLRQSAARLGVVTFAANAHLVEGTKEDGTKYSFAKRDSTTMPQALAKVRDEGRQRAVAAVVAKQPVPSAPPRAVAPLACLTFAQAKGAKRRAEAVAQKLVEDEHLRQVVAATAARGVSQPGSATDRLEALRLRVLGKRARLDDGSSSSR